MERTGQVRARSGPLGSKVTSSKNATALAKCISPPRLNDQRSPKVKQTHYSSFVSAALKRETPGVNNGATGWRKTS